MGFSENWIHIIYNCLSNNWYFVIINGGRYGFFKSSRGLRQGDPLSPSLFILSAELLSHKLTGLQTKIGYKGFYMSANGPQINHLTFADDTIIFCNGDKRSLKMILDTLKKHEGNTGQLINRNKSCFSSNPKLVLTLSLE